MWNLAFVIVSVVMVGCTLDESTNVPIRVWVCGYGLQCLVHVVLVWVEYRRRNRRGGGNGNGGWRGGGGRGGWDLESGGGVEENGGIEDEEEEAGSIGVANRSRLACLRGLV